MALSKLTLLLSIVAQVMMSYALEKTRQKTFTRLKGSQSHYKGNDIKQS